ncbi:MAG: shikimate dehydrogenase, partial [Chloroflexota bacterium]|nr:shikimate dehydrogenase [Chloroflexota bacterium]
MLKCGLIGDPVDHSLSAFMHNAAFEALGIDARYDLWQTTADELSARLASLRKDGMLGANVTVPHKQAVISLVDDVSETARRIGAVNTVIP